MGSETPMKYLVSIRKKDFCLGGLELFYGERDYEGEVSIAQPAVMERVKTGHLLTAPLLTLDEDTCQMLMNELFIAGIRPSKSLSDPEGSSHMKDEIGWLRETADHLMKKVKHG